MGYLDVLRQNQFRPRPTERAERDEPPPDGGPDGAGTKARGGLPCEESEESEESPQGGACARCARLDEAARQVLEQLKAHPALPPALRVLSPERLSILVKWTIVSLAAPRSQWPPRPPTAAQRKHRPGLDGLIESLGGRPLGAEPEPPPPEELDDEPDD
jgi:hypothetical protein